MAFNKLTLPRAPEQADKQTRYFIDVATAILNSLVLDGTIIQTGPGTFVLDGATAAVVLASRIFSIKVPTTYGMWGG